MSLSEQIKYLREKKGWRQKELAARLKTRQSTVSAWEIGRNEPNPAQRKKLCDLFSISEAVLFGGSPANEILSPEILEALQDPIAVKALLVTHKNKQDIKNAIKAILDYLPDLSPEKRRAILALCR
ncbi:MAG: helix-turn-helix transcriptional regulator [Candidatus Omnitrophica bacterium]|nr:helix-turn-helix transcriptional regulator [Candidatus Omnitrophota bacterium]